MNDMTQECLLILLFIFRETVRENYVYIWLGGILVRELAIEHDIPYIYEQVLASFNGPQRSNRMIYPSVGKKNCNLVVRRSSGLTHTHFQGRCYNV